MVRPKQEEIDAQLKRQELDSDGSESVSGSASVAGTDDTADTEEMVKDAFGNEPDDVDGFNSGLEVNKDEKDILMGEDEDEDDEENTDLDIERKERTTEDIAGNDPFDTFTEDDDTEPDHEE